ncbi:hypothetical protein [Phytohabitans rumicis]|uniref:DUF58 domain-containing protein n=1 Tax=Phytohabitans rumicis TaxID=1076125 RepID=A0A6V8LIH0_9ACTN|nr:hypothetical protein [Phytohabitans rumicis]GFJ95350.1 hypothetical protein Prum_089920 [Phytohabitans rumicis]
MRLTRRGLAVLVAGAVLLPFGQWGGYPFLRALGAALLGAVLAAVLLTVRGLTVRVRRSVYPDRVERGRPALASLRVGNPGARRMPGFLATDAAGGAARTIRVRALPAGAEAFYHYELPTGTRAERPSGRWCCTGWTRSGWPATGSPPERPRSCGCIPGSFRRGR